jgi:hypothetical protein
MYFTALAVNALTLLIVRRFYVGRLQMLVTCLAGSKRLRDCAPLSHVAKTNRIECIAMLAHPAAIRTSWPSNPYPLPLPQLGESTVYCENMIRRWIRTTLLLASVLYATSRKPRFEPLEPCDDCISRDVIVAPGIGFDLTTSYGCSFIDPRH